MMSIGRVLDFVPSPPGHAYPVTLLMVLLTLVTLLAAVLSGLVVFVPGLRIGGVLVDVVFLGCVSAFLICLTLLIRRMIRASMAAHLARFEEEQIRAARAGLEEDGGDGDRVRTGHPGASGPTDHAPGRHGSVIPGTSFEPRHAAIHQSRDIRHPG